MKKIIPLSLISLLLSACALPTPSVKDRTAFEQSDPLSILVLPPVNNSTHVEAENSVYSSLTAPIAEAGYYIYPINLTKEFFKANCFSEAADIQQIPYQKLRSVFGADAIFYPSIEEYGSTFQIIESRTAVRLNGKLIDAKTGNELWTGHGQAIETSDSSNGLLGALLNAVLTQVVNSTIERSHALAPRASYDLIAPWQAYQYGWVYGHRSPHYRKQHPEQNPTPKK